MTLNSTHILNGFLDRDISPLDRGFAYGDGVFRTMKVVNGLPLHWPQHYQKLVADCAVIGIVCPVAEILVDDLQHLFTPNETAVAKITITRGEGERGYAVPAVTMPTRMVSKSKYPQYAPLNFTDGVQLKVCETTLSAQPKLAGIKHLNRLENVMARMEWQNDAVFDGILLDTNSNAVECTMSNIFARYGINLVTPTLNQCGVAGITRQQILNLASVLNLNVVVDFLPLSKLLNADEVIICNSLYGAFQATKINHNELTETWQPQALAGAIRAQLKHD